MTNNITVIRTIGKGARLTSAAVEAIIADLPENFDYTARGALAGRVHLWASPDGIVPAMTDKAKNRTDYGNGVNTIVTALKKALAPATETKVALTVSLSGEGGGSTVVPTDHPLYADLVALLGN